MNPPLTEIFAPILIGAGITIGAYLSFLVYARFKREEGDGPGFWESVVKAEGKNPSLREKAIMSGAVIGGATLLLLALYAWTIGFSGYSGTVEEKTATSLGRFGQPALIVDGEMYEVERDVHFAAKKGSHIVRPWARPYVVLDDKAYVPVWPLGFFGAVGVVVFFVAAVILVLCWWPCREGQRQCEPGPTSGEGDA